MSRPDDVPKQPQALVPASTWVALSVAILGTLGSLWLSYAMALKACPLCLYQRTFIMGVVAVLLIGVLTPLRHSPLLSLLALPAAVGGLGVALFHEYLELAGKLECPEGIFGLGTAPQQSLGVFLVLVGTLLVSLASERRSVQPAVVAWVAAPLLGALFAIATIKTAPPMPAPPTKPYDQPLEICRPPFRSPPNGRSSSSSAAVVKVIRWIRK